MKRLYAFRQDPEYTVELYESCVREYKLGRYNTYKVTHKLDSEKSKVVSAKNLIQVTEPKRTTIKYIPNVNKEYWKEENGQQYPSLTDYFSLTTNSKTITLQNDTDKPMLDTAFLLNLTQGGSYSITFNKGANSKANIITGTTSSSSALITISGVTIDISGLYFENVTRPLFDISNNSTVRLSNITISGNKVSIDKTSLINIKNSSSIIQNLTVRDINTSLLNIDVGSKSGIELSGISINNGSNTSTNNRALIRYVSSVPQFSSIRTASAGVTPTPQPSPPTPQPLSLIHI